MNTAIPTVPNAQIKSSELAQNVLGLNIFIKGSVLTSVLSTTLETNGLETAILAMSSVSFALAGIKLHALLAELIKRRSCKTPVVSTLSALMECIGTGTT